MLSRIPEMAGAGAVIALARVGARVGLAVLAVLAVLGAADAGERIKRKIVVGGLKRTYTMYLPDNPAARKAWPVIFAFHPAVAKGGWMERTARLHAFPGGRDYVVVYPDAYYLTWNAGDCCGKAHARNIDDLGFFNAMLRDIAGIIPIKRRVYLTGFSNGARLTYHIMCLQPETVAAAVPVGATRNMDRCRPGRVALMHIHGAADRGSPVEGGFANDGTGSAFDRQVREDIGYMEPAADVVRVVARRNGCSTARLQNIPKPRLGTICQAYTSCPANAVAMLCVVPNMGHAWPGGRKGFKMFGPYRPDLRGSAEVIDFFNRHR